MAQSSPTRSGMWSNDWNAVSRGDVILGGGDYCVGFNLSIYREFD